MNSASDPDFWTAVGLNGPEHQFKRALISGVALGVIIFVVQSAVLCAFNSFTYSIARTWRVTRFCIRWMKLALQHAFSFAVHIIRWLYGTVAELIWQIAIVLFLLQPYLKQRRRNQR